MAKATIRQRIRITIDMDTPESADDAAELAKQLDDLGRRALGGVQRALEDCAVRIHCVLEQTHRPAGGTKFLPGGPRQ